MKNVISLINNVDYAMLRDQKQNLISISVSGKVTSEQRQQIAGLLHFIDNFQNAVSADRIKDDAEIFGESEDEE